MTQSNSRRDFLKRGATAAALSAAPMGSANAWWGRNIIPRSYEHLVPEIFNRGPGPGSHTEALVIGSGFGGAIAAYRLAQAGVQTSVLERGSRWPVSNGRRVIHPSDFLPDGRSYWHRNSITHISGIPYHFDKFGGTLDVTDYENISVWRGACVGGGSKVFTGVMIEPEEQYFKAVFGDAVDYEEMHQRWYPLVRRMLNLSSIPESLYRSAPFTHSREWDRQVRAAGYAPERIDGLWNWDVVANERSWFKRRSATVGESNHGHSNGAKFDLTQNYLKYAEQLGANIHPGIQVKAISQDNQARYQVIIDEIDPYGDVIVADKVITCDRLFLAAGSIGTSELLVRARDTGTLSNLNEEVGMGWGSNGDAAVIRSNSRYRSWSQASPSATKVVDVASSGMGVTLENWFALHVPVEIGVSGSLGMTLDLENRAKFEYDPHTNKVNLDWKAGGNDDSIAALREINNHIADASNTDPGVPFLSTDVNASFTAHPLGGAILGKATDNYGRVHGYHGLYVVDGAMVNGNTGAVNPSLTISALAERNMAHILNRQPD